MEAPPRGNLRPVPTSPVTPPLHYEHHPVIGQLRVDARESGQLTLTLLRDRNMIVRGAALLVAGSALLIFGLVLYPWSGSFQSAASYIFVWFFIGGASAIAGALNELIIGLHPTIVHLDTDQLTRTRRGLTEVRRIEWERRWIVDLAVKRLGFTDTISRPFALFLVLSNDERVELIRGTRAETKYAAGVIREELELPPEGWLEEGYPPPPPGRLRVTRSIQIDGIKLSIRPPRLAWRALLLALPVVVIASGALVVYLSRQPWTFTDVSSWSLGWTLLQVGLFSLFGLLALGGLIYRIRPQVTIHLHDGGLSVNQTGLLHPHQADWPLESISGFVTTARPSGDAALQLVLTNLEQEPLARGRRRDVEWAAENLTRALVRLKPTEESTPGLA